MTGAERAAAAAAAGLGLAAIAFGIWTYRMPPGCSSPLGLAPEATAQFRSVLGVGGSPATAAHFRLGLGVVIAAASAAYGVLLAALGAGARLSSTVVRRTSAAFALAFALFVPPALSADVYSYIGYARMALVHHLDPYAATQPMLIARGDPTGPFLRGAIASPYGPLWTLISIVATAPFLRAPLWFAVVAMKLVAAGGWLAVSAAGRRLAERMRPGWGDAAFAALAWNPFFLIEAAGNGHSDLVMMACLLWALVAATDRRLWRGLVLLGCAGAIKFVPLLLTPWLLVRDWRERGRGGASLARLLVIGALVVAGPLVLSYTPFWHGASTLAGLQQRWATGAAAHGWPGTWGTIGVGAALAAAYALGSKWAIRDLDGLVAAWTLTSTVALVLLTGVWFPWYWAWPWAAALTRWDRRARVVTFLLFCLVVAFTLGYSGFGIS